MDQNPPFDSPPAEGEQNKTLAFLALGLGITSFICLGPIGSFGAFITGFMARKKESENPAEFGGSGLATIGIILGVISLLLYVIALGLWLFLAVLSG